MWFNNALIYHYELNDTLELSALFAEETLKPCPPHARFTYGWLPVFGDTLVQEIAGSALICLGKEERILPRGVINKLLVERVKTLEAQQARTVKRAEKAQLAEDLEFELLPKSFCVQKRLLALFDTTTKRLIINTTSDAQATQLLSLLRKTLPGLHLKPLFHTDNLAVRFSQWMTNAATMPSTFQLASDCKLFSEKDDKKRVICKGYELPAEEIVMLLSQGLVAAELSLIWNERIQFTLTNDLTLKRLKSLGYLIDEFNELNELDDEHSQQDARLTLLSGELKGLIDDLLANLIVKEAITNPATDNIDDNSC
jgi:recombination associated protein RdgC